jgi:hypothetical protein
MVTELPGRRTRQRTPLSIQQEAARLRPVVVYNGSSDRICTTPKRLVVECRFHLGVKLAQGLKCFLLQSGRKLAKCR